MTDVYQTLAYVIFTVLSPPNMEGVQFSTVSPVECAAYIDATIPEFEQAGMEVMAQCTYTTAPVYSLPPRLRGD